jgi:predicted protein tyrosine phosphatase
MSIQQVIIFSQGKVANFQAKSEDKPVYLIRIFDSPNAPLAFLPYSQLKSPEQFETIKSYTFDDVSRFLDDDLIVFNDKIAQQIIRDFDENGKKCKTLLVHCRAGKSRSPAVAIALSEIFHLKTKAQLAAMKINFPIYNKRVYKMMLDVKMP